jgi:hypothetical protein
MMVALIDQGDVDRRAFEMRDRLQPAEPGPNDHDMMTAGHYGSPP